jgi:predicted O-methyltransferase YrrM
MNASRRQIAHDLYTESRAHDEGLPRLRRFRNLEPPTAELLGIMIRAAQARQILELGTSNGYSTIWLADAAEATGGAVVSVDIDAARSELARENLARVGLDEQVQLLVGDAAEVLAGGGDGEWDFILVDSERSAYTAYLPDLLRTLAPGGVIAVDNVLSHEHELVEFTAAVEAVDSLTQSVVPVGAGLRIAVRDQL